MHIVSPGFGIFFLHAAFFLIGGVKFWNFRANGENLYDLWSRRILSLVGGITFFIFALAGMMGRV